MSGAARFRRWLHLARPVEEDIDLELAYHLDRTTEDLVARGYPLEAAREEARRRFGDLQTYRESLRRIDRDRRGQERRADRLEAAQKAIAHACRGVRRNPGFAAVVALTLGLGVGINAAMYGILDRLLFRAPAHVRQADEVRRIYVRRGLAGQSFVTATLTWPDIADLQTVRGFSAVAARSDNELVYGRGESARRIPVELVSPAYFDLLGVRPERGRFLLPADDSLTGATGTAVVSHGFWQRDLGGASDVLGRTLELGEGQYTVVGVAPPGFTGMNLARVDVWLPVRTAASEVVGGPWETSRGFYWLDAIVRLAPGTTLPQAEAMATAAHCAGRASDHHYDARASIIAAPLLAARGPDVPAEARISVWVAGVSLVVLLIACANVANLLLFRAVRRRREIAVRLALGISRRRLAGELLTESLVLALLGGAGGLLLAAWGGGALRGLLFPEVSWVEPPLSLPVVLFTLGTALTAGLVAGLIPAWLESRPDLLSSLKSGSPGRGGRHSIRAALVVVQAGLSVLLLVGAALFVLSFRRVQSVDLGMEPDRVLAVTPRFPSGTPDTRVSEVYRQAIERLAALPGVEHVAAATTIPFRGNWAEGVVVPGWDSLPRVETGGPYVDGVTPEYFAGLGMRIVKGRGFTAGDRAGSQRVAVVGETMARLLWPGDTPIGKCMKVGGDTMPCTEVVGLVADVQRNGLKAGERMQYYLPLTQYHPGTPSALFVRAERPLRSAEAVRRALTAIAPELRLVETIPFADIVAPQFRAWKMGAGLFTGLGLLALAVAAVGLYSLLSYGVADRTREIGVRSALGARPSGIVGLVLREGLVLVGIGIALGVGMALLAARFVAPLLFHTSPAEPAAYGAVALTLAMIALAASVAPALRAARVDPMTALRSE